jgi:hypothetical protein
MQSYICFEQCGFGFFLNVCTGSRGRSEEGLEM